MGHAADHFLNVLTLVLVAVPLFRITGSILLTELAVVLVEMVGIAKIFQVDGIQLSPEREGAYSLLVNFLTWAIGFMVL